MFIRMITAWTMLTTATLAWSVDEKITVDLSGVASKLGIEVSDISHYSVHYVDASNSWTLGYIGDVDKRNFSLASENNIAPKFEMALQINSLDDGSKIDLAACNSSLSCQKIDLGEQTKSPYKFNINGKGYKLTLYGNPCKSKSCSILVPSWNFTMRRASKNQNLIPFPNLALVLKHGKFLSIVNAVNGQVWNKFEIGQNKQISDLGQLYQVSIFGEGILRAEFASGTILLDFIRDRVVLVDGNGLYLTNESLANVATSDFKQVNFEEISLSSNQDVILLDLHKTIWGQMVCDIDLTTLQISGKINSCTENYGNSVSADQSSMDQFYLYHENINGAQISAFDSSKNNTKEVARNINLNLANQEAAYLMRGHFYIKTASNGIKLVKSDSSRVATTIGDSNATLYIASSGALIKQSTQNGKCIKEVYYLSDKSPESFLRHHLTYGCSSDITVNYNDGKNVLIGAKTGSSLEISRMNVH